MSAYADFWMMTAGAAALAAELLDHAVEGLLDALRGIDAEQLLKLLQLGHLSGRERQPKLRQLLLRERRLVEERHRQAPSRTQMSAYADIWNMAVK